MRIVPWDCSIVIALACATASSGWAAPGGKPKASLAELREAEEEALLGDWLGTSYDFDGRTEIPLKECEHVALSFQRIRHGMPQQPGLVTRFTAALLEDVGDRTPENGAYGGAGNCLLDVSGTPHLVMLNPNEILGASGQIPLQLRRQFQAMARIMPPTVPRVIAYLREGDRLSFRMCRSPAGRRISLSTRKGQPTLVFHLKRTANAFRIPPDEAARSKTQSANELTQKSTSRGALGTWVGVSYQKGGGPMCSFEPEEGARLALTREGYFIDLRLGNGQAGQCYRGKCDVDLTKDPQQYRAVSPEERSQLIGLFHCKGDELLWLNFADGQKPTKLEADAVGETVLIRLRRAQR